MARLRFPGRPGCRFDRLGVRYGADEARNANDPLTLFVANIHRGLRAFRELVGDSDEDDEFEGFTKEDVRQAEKKLQKVLAEEAKSDITSPVSPKSGTRLSRTRESLENLPSAECTRNRKSTLVRKSYKEMINEGLATPSKSYVIKKAKESGSARGEVQKEMKKSRKDSKSTETMKQKAYKKFKIRLDVRGKVGKIVHNRGRPSKFKNFDTDDMEQSVEVDENEDHCDSEKGKKKAKEKDKFSAVGKAKQLLQRAKTCKKDKVSPEQTTKRKISVKKQFVLPVQSSRSSRVIIPNKRFIEEDSENTAKAFAKRLAVKVPEESKTLAPESKLPTEMGLFANASTKLQIETEKLPSLPMSSLSPSGIVKPKFEALTGIGGFQSPLYDQPLIVEGKRARKPSLKVRMKMSDSSFKKFKERSLEKKLEARKIIEQEKVKLNEQDYLQEGRKLFLSPSKLSVSLTSKLPSLPIMAPPKFGVAPFTCTALSERERLEKLEREALVKRMRGHNILRKAKFQLNRAALNRSKADLARTLKKELKMEARLQKIQESQKNKSAPSASGVRLEQAIGDDGSDGKHYICRICERGMNAPRRRGGILTCESCRKFFQSHSERVSNGRAVPCPTGSCTVHYKDRPICQDCRYNKCLKLFNLENRRTSLDPNTQATDFSKEINVTIPQITLSSASPGTSGLMNSPLGPLKSPSMLSPMATTSPPATTTTSSPETDDSPKSDGRGPRIKHVCRKAAVVLGKPVAKFPKSPEITLSALPSGEKVKLWKKDQQEKKDLSDDEIPMEDIIQQSEDNIQAIKKSPIRSPLKIPKGRYGKRKIRCKKCEGCTSEDCGVCNYCLDKPKFGGRGVMKQACIQRRCKYPRYSRLAPGSLMRARDSDNQSDGSSISPYKDGFSSSPSQQARYRDNQDDVLETSNKTTALSVIQRMALQGNRLSNAAKLNNDKSLASKRPFSEVLTPEDVSRRLWQEFGHAPQSSFPKFPSSSNESIRLSNSSQPKRMITNFRGYDGRSDAMVMHSVTSARGWSAQNEGQHRIKAEYREVFELTKVWYSGVSLTVSGPMCVRVICFLCGSAGKHEMLYCNVCCEPFHEFCLEEEERPHEIHSDNWCCKKCQSCQVCGRQNNLLQCDKCQNTYHPECLGPNYPTKPSKKKNIWICTKCVKCKSCGATTPGSGSAATWMYDFQLCYECGQLMDKGNYCPICHKCYSDDDWDSKMVQCASCESWVHAKCEELTDEMYERMSVLPDDVHYICKICSPRGPRHWEVVLKDSFLDGLKSVFNTVTQAKCAQHLLHIDEKKVNELEEKLNEQKYGDALKTTMELEKSLENFVTSLEKVLKSKNKSAVEQQQEGNSSEKGTSVVDLVGDGEKKVEEKAKDDKDDSLIRFEGDEDMDETKSSVTEDKSDVEMAEVLNDSDTISIGDVETLSALTTPGVSRGVSPNSSAGSPRVGADDVRMGSPLPPDISENIAQRKEEEAVDSTEGIAANIPNVDLLLNVERDEVDGSKKEKSVTGTSIVDNQSNEQSNVLSADVREEESQSNICDTDSSVTGPKPQTNDQNIDLSEKEIKQELIENSKDIDQTPQFPVVQSSSKKSGGVVDLTVEKSVSFQLSTPTKGLVTPTKALSRRLAENRLLPGFIRLYPKDFNAVKLKMINEEYSSVNEFSEDMAHIINLALNDPDEMKLVRKKATNSVRSMFVKQMEKCFPWFNVKACQIWDKNQNFPPGMLPDAVLPPFEDHTYAQWLEREDPHKSPQPSPFKRVGNTPIKKIVPLPVDEDAEKVLSCDLEDSGEDIRRCILCWHYGDSDPNDAGRLLYVGQDDWVHVNCALWSAEVYEEEHDGTLQNVQTALSRGRVMRCDSCQRAGATVGCCTRGCPANYHFMCARHELCLFQEDKKVFCPQHREKVDGELVAKEKFAVNRRVCVSMEDLKFNKKTWSKGLDPSTVSVIVGSCTVEELGRLSPISDTKDLLLPVEFSSTRVFWSTQDIRKRCVYTCRIVEVKPDSPKSAAMLIKDITIIHDETHPDYVPLSQINIPGINLFPDSRPRTQSLELSGLSEESGFSKSFDMSGDCEILNSTLNSNQSFSASDVGNDSLSSSWPVVKKRKTSDPAVNLGVLSPNTLRLLNLKDPQKFQQTVKPCSQEKDDFGTLIKIADRLNMAASGKSDVARTMPRRERSKSVDRLLSPPPVRFSPSFRSEGHQSAGNTRTNSRANSEERMFSPIPTMSLQKQLSMNKEVTTVKPLIDDNCNTQVTDLNKAEDSIETGESNSQEASLEPINEEGTAEVDPANETYVVLPEGCSELSDEDLQMITEAIERSRSEQATDESMVSVESTEEHHGEISKEANPDSLPMGFSSDKEDASKIQEKTSNTDDEKESSDLPENTKEPSPNEGINADSAVSYEQADQSSSLTNKVHSDDLSCSDEQKSVKTLDGQFEDEREFGVDQKEQETCPVSNSMEAMEVTEVTENQQTTSSPVDKDVSTIHDVEEQLMFKKESVPESMESVQEKGLDKRSLESREAVEGIAIEKMDTEIMDSNQGTSSAITPTSCSRETSNTQATSLEVSDNVTQKAMECTVVADEPSLTPPEGVKEQTSNEKTTKQNDRIPVYGREGQLIGYRKLTVERPDLRRLHYTTRRPTFEEILSEAQKQLLEEKHEDETMPDSREREMILECQVQPSESVVMQPDNFSAGDVTDKKSNECAESLLKTGEVKTEDNVVVDKDLVDMSESDDMWKESNEVVKVTEIDSTDKSDIEKNEMDIKVEACDKVIEECEKQKTCESETADINEDKTTALESSSSSNREQNPLDEVSVKDAIIPDTRTEEEKNDLFKGLGLARTPEAKKTKAEMKKTPIKSYPLRRRSTQGGASSERKGDLPLHDQIAQKIKAESLAKSSPGAKGPFKCPTCKRLYRTEESFETHVKTCDFEVSTSDEEEESENEGGARKYSMRQTTVVKKVVMEIEQKERESESAARKERFSSFKTSCQKARLVLHKLSPRKVQQGIAKLSPRKRGRPFKTGKDEIIDNKDLKGPKRFLSSDDEKKNTENERKRRQSSQSEERAVSSDRHTRKSLCEVKAEDVKTKEVDDSESDVSPKRGRGRPRKSSIVPNEQNEEEKSLSTEEKKSSSTEGNKSKECADKTGIEKRGRGRPRKSSLMSEEDIKKEIVASEECNSQEESLSESSPVSKRGRGRSRRESAASDSTSIGCTERSTRRSSTHGKNDDEFVSPPTPKRGRGRPSKCSDGISPKGQDRKSSNNEVTPEKKTGGRGRPSKLSVRHVLRSERKLRELSSIKNSRPVRRKKGVNLEYPGLTSGVTKRNAILSRKFKALRDSKIKKQKLKQALSVQGKTLSGTALENGIKRGRGRPRKFTAGSANNSDGHSQKKELKNVKNEEHEKVKVKTPKVEERKSIEKTEGNSDEMEKKSNKGQNSETDIKDSILNVIKQSNTSSLLKCPVPNVKSNSEEEVIMIADDEDPESDVIFCEKTGDFLNKKDKKQTTAKSCEIQCDLDDDNGASQKSSGNLSMLKNPESKNKKSDNKTVEMDTSKSATSKSDPLGAEQSRGSESKMEDSSSTDLFVDRIMNDPAIQQLTPIQLLELQNKVTDKKVDLSSLTKIDTEATIKSIKAFLKKKIEEGTNKTMYVTDTGNGKDQGSSSSGEKSSVMKVNLPSSVTPQDIQKIIEAHKRATGTLGKSESSIGITPISRSSPLQSLTSQSTTSVLSSVSTSSRFTQAQSQPSISTVQTNLAPPSSNSVLPQNFDISSQITVAANNLLAAANAVSPSAMMQSPNAILPSQGAVISHSPPNLQTMNTLLPSNPTPVAPVIVPSQSAILPVNQQLPMMSPSPMLASPQPAIVTGGIQTPMYSVSSTSPGYQALSSAIVTVPEPQKTYLLPPNQNLITVPQSQNLLTVPPHQLMNPSIPQQLDNYLLSLINNAGIRVSQNLLNSGVSPVINTTQYVQNVPQVHNIPPLQNVPNVISNMGLQTDIRPQGIQNQSPVQIQGPAIKTVPMRPQLTPYVNQNTSLVASNAVYPTSTSSTTTTLVRVFVDGKPIAMTTDASVLNDPTSLLAKLNPSALQKGKYNMSVTSHRVTSTTTLTVSSKGSGTTYRAHCSSTTANKVLSALLKNRSETSLSTSMKSGGLKGKPIGPASSERKTIFRKISDAASRVTLSSLTGGSLPSSSMAIQAASHTRLPPAIAQSRSLLPASMKLQQDEGEMMPDLKTLGVKPYIIRKADGTIVKRIIKTTPKGVDLEKNFAIQPKVMKAIMKKLGGEKAVPILGKHGKNYDIMSVRVKTKAAVKAKEKKKKHNRKSPQKVRLGLPQSSGFSGTMSHPFIHSHKETLSLPQPALEEEVEETPLCQFQQEQRDKRLGRSKKEGPKLQFQISSDDGFSCKGETMEEAWQQVIEKVQDVRSSARMKNLSFTNLDPDRLFGVNFNSVIYLLEQLFGAQNCRNYNFKYHQYDITDLEEEPPENPSGCIRSEPYETRKPFDIFSFLMSQYREMPGSKERKNDVEMVHKSARRATSMDLPMAMRFRKLKEHAREAVGVYRSHIHGRGLYCKRNIDEGEMVIEYSGEVIRGSLTDKREKYYEGKGIGCYMFRIDDYDVIDATLHGNAARFINHSCEPNCYSKVINVDGKKHIVIFAMKSIKRGEELTYDYKFPIEEVKIPCTCGAKKCRRYLN